MNKININPWLLIAVLFTLNCTNVSDASDIIDDATNKGNAANISATSDKIDTLCAYEWRSSWKIEKTHIFQNNAQLTAFLDATGYDEKDTVGWTIKKMAHQPDFKKWTYFALAGHDWRNTLNIKSENDTVVIEYTEFSVPPPCAGSKCPAYAPPVKRSVVYLVPFTKKPIKFTETIK